MVFLEYIILVVEFYNIIHYYLITVCSIHFQLYGIDGIDRIVI